jgi:hypothetical protein
MLFYFFGNRFTPWIDIAAFLMLIFGGRWVIRHFDLTQWRRRLAILSLILLFFLLAPLGTQIVVTTGIYAFFLYSQVAGIHMT